MLKAPAFIRAVLKCTVLDKTFQFWGSLAVCIIFFLTMVTIGTMNLVKSEGNLKALARVQGCEYLGLLDQYKRVALMACEDGAVKMFVNPYYGE